MLVSSGYHNKIPETGGLRQHEFISHSSRGWKFKIKGSENLVVVLFCFPEASLLDLPMAVFLYGGPHVAFSVCVSLASLPFLIRTPVLD